MLCIEGSAGHSRCTCVDRPSRSAAEQFERRVVSMERTATVHSRSTRRSIFMLFVVSGVAVLSKTIETFFTARFVRF